MYNLNHSFPPIHEKERVSTSEAVLVQASLALKNYDILIYTFFGFFPLDRRVAPDEPCGGPGGEGGISG
jgi:hypothetical protein